MPGSDNLTPTRRRISRETRRLLTAALLALVSLWALARVRFPDRPVAPNPIPSLLPRLAPARFSGLADEVAELQRRLSPAWVPLPAEDQGTRETLTALRYQDETGVTLVRSGGPTPADEVVLAADAATGLTLVRLDRGPLDGGVVSWMPGALDEPRYLMATSAAAGAISLRPVLVGSLAPARSPAWSGPIWLPPQGTDLGEGSFLFTPNAELVGLVARDGPDLVIVPASVLLAEAAAVLERGTTREPSAFVSVQSLTPGLAGVTGANEGVVVTWVDPNGPAADAVSVGDVIERINDATVGSVRAWEVALQRLTSDSVALGIRRDGSPIEVRLPTAPQPPAPTSPNGLVLRMMTGVGAAVVAVRSGSAADFAGLEPGDILTRIGSIQRPTPLQVQEAFNAASAGEALLIAFTRGDDHHVSVISK